MIRDELHRLRESFRSLSGIEITAYVSLILIIVIVTFGLIYIAPVAGVFKPWLFTLATLTVITAIVMIYYHRRPQHYDDTAQPEAGRQKEMAQTMPPKPTRLPILAVDNQSLTPAANANLNVVISNNPPPRRRLRRRTVFRELTIENGVSWLVIHTYTPIPKGPSKKKLWKHKVQKLELDDSPDVDIRLATKIPIFPTDGETKIYCLERLHWWSHGPIQIGILVGSFLIIGLLLFVGLHSDDLGATLVVVSVFVVGCGIWYYVVWMRWAYRYLIFTNLKIRLTYRPPFNLPSSTPLTDLTKLTGGTNPKSSWWGNTIGYGKIRTETVASEVDRWLLEDVRYVKAYERKAHLLDQLREDAELKN